MSTKELTVKIFVAGATGVVGRRLLPLLTSAGHDVVGMSRSADRAAGLERYGVRGVVGDVLDPGSLRDLLDDVRPEIVVHQVTDIPKALEPGKTEEQFAANVLVRTTGTRNLVQAARAAGTRRIIAQSYAHVYAPIGGWIKIESDELDTGDHVPEGRRRNVDGVITLERAVLTTPGIEGVALRYGALYGPGTSYDLDGGSLAELVRARQYPLVGGGTGWTSFLHVDDAAAATVLALDGPAGVYNITDDRPAPASEWLPYYASVLGALPPRHVPALAIRALGREHFAFRATRQRAADNRKARARLGYTPIYRTWRDGWSGEVAVPVAA
jgi:nucleoside-diphosphate-sugar epimerase